MNERVMSCKNLSKTLQRSPLCKQKAITVANETYAGLTLLRDEGSGLFCLGDLLM